MSVSAVRIAVVDDDAAVCRALARLLRVSGFQVQTYGSAHAFLASLGQSIPDCAILDLEMPEMNGLELQQHLALTGFHIPVILTTARSDSGTCGPAHADATACLVKPLKEASLLAAINAAMGRFARHPSPSQAG